MKSKIALLLVMLASTIGCHRSVKIVNTPPGVAPEAVQNWFAAAGIFKELGQYTNELTKSAVNLHQDFPSELSYQNTLVAIADADKIGIQAGAFLESVPQTWNSDVSSRVQGYVNAIADQLKLAIDDGFAHVKNSQAKDALNVLVDLVNSAIKTGLAIASSPVSVPTGDIYRRKRYTLSEVLI